MHTARLALRRPSRRSGRVPAGDTEDLLHGLDAPAADGAPPRMAHHSAEALFATALVPARHHQVVRLLVETNATSAVLLQCRRARLRTRIGGLLLEVTQDAPEHFFRLERTLDAPNPPRKVRQHPTALSVEDSYALSEGGLVVPISRHDAVSDLGWRWDEIQVEDVAGLRVDSPLRGASDERLAWNIKNEDAVDLHQALKLLGLIRSAGEAVQQTPMFAHIGLLQAPADVAQH
mmetsp:Transcript_94654/g.272523  ORF Transcript_94654/g.272523 Transcript_94654/m.272523 type:complete len:233 (-) Transcript_94654:240-938(-)